MHLYKPSSVRFFPQASNADANNAVSGLRIDRMSIRVSKTKHCFRFLKNKSPCFYNSTLTPIVINWKNFLIFVPFTYKTRKIMKKIFSALMLMACLCLAIPAQAQLQFGVKAGLNVSKVSISKEVFNPDNRAGFFVGPTADLTLPLLGLGLDASVLYNQYGIDTEEGSTMKKSIEIPINVKWTFGFSSLVGAYVAAGPQFGFNVGHRTFKNICEFKKNNTTFNVGAGLKLFSHVHVGATYNIALKDNGIMKKPVDGGKPASDGFKQNTWQISLAYMF